MKTDTSAERHQDVFVPFLKWAGGKRWLLASMPALMGALRKTSGSYIEPFLGSGAMFFAVRPKKAILNDANAELVNLYRLIKADPKGISRLLGKYQTLHSPSFYYRVRSAVPRTNLSSAVRFLYLNRTCWNGLYRVNQSGEFNVPIGTKSAVVLSTDDFEEARRRLRSATLCSSDFSGVVSKAKVGDTIFADPPYTVNHNLNGFLKYNEKLFSWDDQVRLHGHLLKADARGVRVVVTNADHESIRDLYRDKVFFLKSTPRYSKLSGKRVGRKQITELIISNFRL